MLQTILEHKTIRKYKPDSVSQNLLNEILEAGTRASTTGNMQVYSIIVSQKQETKDKLWECHFKQNMVKQAPIVLTFCADFNRFNKWCELREAQPGYDNFQSFFTAAIDALLVAQNVALAAEANGLGICYLGTTTYLTNQIIEVLNLPKGVVPITTLTIGYADENPPQAERLPLSGVVHYETYCDYSSQQIDEIYKEKEALEVNQKFVRENNKQTLAQVFTDVRYTKQNNETFSKLFLEAIKRQNFSIENCLEIKTSK